MVTTEGLQRDKPFFMGVTEDRLEEHWRKGLGNEASIMESSVMYILFNFSIKTEVLLEKGAISLELKELRNEDE